MQTAGVQAYRQVNVRSVASGQSHDLFLSGIPLVRSPRTGALTAPVARQPNRVALEPEADGAGEFGRFTRTKRFCVSAVCFCSRILPAYRRFRPSTIVGCGPDR